ncbi:MAG: aminotransferase class V-fold PLP-dependent enzyme [Acidobacteriota bacterium]
MAFDLHRWLPEFPIREECLYLDHAAVCPLPKSVAEAMRLRIRDQEMGGHTRDKAWRNVSLTCRHVGSELIGCSPEDISLIRSTSEGLSLIAEGMDWAEDDEVLVGAEEFAANAAPWLNLQTRGVKIIRFPQTDGRVDPEEVERHVSEKTRLLAVSWVSFHTGWIAPLIGLAGLCRERNIIFVLDAIQGLGVLPLKMQQIGIDAVVADGHKWLLGPEGAGLMATSTELRKRLRPVLSGWRNIRMSLTDAFLEKPDYREDGRKFEPGATNSVGLAGMSAALDLLTTVGPETVLARVESLNRALTRILLAHGWDLRSPGSGHPVAGIVSGRPPGGDADEARRALEERHVICSVRQDLVRFSPHFYTSGAELEALDRILTKCHL